MLVRPLSIEDNYILNIQKSFFSIVLPEEGINLIHNPEVFDLEGYTSTFNNISIDTNTTHYGIHSMLADLPSGFWIETTIPFIFNLYDEYTFSFSVLGSALLKIDFMTTTNQFICDSKIVETQNFWSRYHHSIKVSQIPFIVPVPPYNIKCRITAMEECRINLSAFQLERQLYPTTFISGNLGGFNRNERPIPYYWTGVPHRSPSIRTKYTRDGGKIINLKDIGVDVISYDGLGLPEFDHIATPLISKPGSLYRTSALESRDLTILGVIYSKNVNELFAKRSILTKGTSPFLLARRQPVKLLFQIFDCLTPKTEQLEINCIYNGGLEGEFGSLYGERVSIDFIMYDPFIYKSGNEAHQLCLTNQPNPQNGIIYRNSIGTWHSTPSFPRHVNDMDIGADNNLYLGHSTGPGSGGLLYRFTEPNTLTIVGNSITAGEVILKVQKTKDNKLYVGGSFNQIRNNAGVGINFVGTGAATDKRVNIARYNIATNLFEYIGRLQNSDLTILPSVRAIEILKNGNVVFGGNFNQAVQTNNTVIPCKNIIIYNPTADIFYTVDVNFLITGIGTTAEYINVIKEDLQGFLWVGGKFVDNIGNPAAGAWLSYVNIVKLTPTATVGDIRYDALITLDGLTRRSARTSLVQVGTDQVFDIEQDDNGAVYAAGIFDSTPFFNTIEASLPVGESLTVNPYFIAKHNGGFGFTGIGFIARLNDAFPDQVSVFDLEKELNTGNIWFCGNFNFAGAAKYLLVNDITPNALARTLKNPADFLNEYTANTYQIGKFNQTTFEGQQIFTPVGGTGDYRNLTKLKFGGFYAPFSYISTFAIPPNTPFNLSEAGYENTLYTNLRNEDVYILCTTEVDALCGDIFYPVLTILGPGKLISIRNYDGGGNQILFNKTLLEGEVLVIDWTGPIPLINSNLFGDQSNIILPGSSLSTFKLVNGINHVLLFVDPLTIDANTKAYLTWKESFIDIDTAVFCN